MDGIYSRNEVHATGLTLADRTVLYAPTILAPNKSGLEIVTSYADEGVSTGTLKQIILFDMSAQQFITISAKTIDSSFISTYTQSQNDNDYYYGAILQSGKNSYALLYNYDTNSWEIWDDVKGTGHISDGWIAWEETYMGSNGCPTSLPEINADKIKVRHNGSWTYATDKYANSVDTGSICGVTEAVFDSDYFDWRVNN